MSKPEFRRLHLSVFSSFVCLLFVLNEKTNELSHITTLEANEYMHIEFCRLTGSVVLPNIVVITVLVASSLAVKSVEGYFCIPYLSQACSIMAFR